MILHFSKQIISKIQKRVTEHTVLTALSIGLLYLIIFQFPFSFSSGVWAETHMEYLNRALHENVIAAFLPGWAGYLAILPAFLTKLYVGLHLPLGYIDYFFQISTVVFALFSASIIAHPYFRALIKNDWVRIGLAVAMLIILNEKAIFSFINIWYAGFIPIILACLVHQRFKTLLSKIIFVIGGVLISLTKPSLLLAPFVLYRAVKTKEYITCGTVLVAIVIQTAVMIFLDPRESATNAPLDIPLALKAVFTGVGVELLKLVRIIPEHFVWVVAANGLIVALLIAVWRQLGLLRTLLILFGLAFSAYLYVLAPDAPVFTQLSRYMEVYNFNLKTQREFLINAFLVILFCIAIQFAWKHIVKLSTTKTLYIKISLILVSVLFILRIYIPIAVESPGVAANIDDFRQSITMGQTTCMPIPPTPAYFPSQWHFAYNTDVCHGLNFDMTPNLKHMTVPLSTPHTLSVPNKTGADLKTLYIAVKNDNPQQPATLILEDKLSSVRYTARIPSRSNETIHFIPINLAGMGLRENYEFTIFSDNPHIYWGRFVEDSQKYIYYAYFAQTRTTQYR